jgi:hypothetical protein
MAKQSGPAALPARRRLFRHFQGSGLRLALPITVARPLRNLTAFPDALEIRAADSAADRTIPGIAGSDCVVTL